MGHERRVRPVLVTRTCLEEVATASGYRYIEERLLPAVEKAGYPSG